MRIVFRTDASFNIGTGHVMRCLTLARALRQKGAVCHFIMRAHPGDLRGRTEAEGFSVTFLPKPEGPQPKAPPCHAQWAGVSWEKDAAQSRAALEQIPDWLVVDHYAFDRRWESTACPVGTRLMVLDDLADRPHLCDLLLDQGLGRSNYEYDELVPRSCKRLIGADFALLAPEFAARRPLSRKVRKNRMPRRILVSMGGFDTANHLPTILEAINFLPEARELLITVVVSSGAPHVEGLRRVCDHVRYTMELRVDANDMASIMHDADLAITASGLTAYELACMAVPMLLLPVSDIQVKVARLLSQKATAWMVENWREDPLSLISDALARSLAALSTCAIEERVPVVDGLGTQRVVAAMLGSGLIE